jgi:radical SAM superfamily enzyme YgiQ (UPF0313 family)
MKVLLLYPPDRRIPTVPYASLATLAAPLRQRGHEVLFRDVAAEVFHHLVKPERLAGYYDYGEKRFAELESKATLDPHEAGIYRGLAQLLTTPKEFLLRCRENVEIFRTPELFYQPQLFNRAYDEIWSVIRLLYAGSPTFNPYSYTYVDDVLKAIETSLGDPISDALNEGILDSVIAQEPDVIGVTVPFSIQFFEAMKTLHFLKQRLPRAKIVLGGQTVNDFHETLFADARLFRVIDYAVFGEGENAVWQLMEMIEGRRRPEEVVNIYWNEGGTVRKSPLPPDIVDLNEQPTLDFRGTDFSQYLGPEPIVQFQTSRGCYYGKCAFCGDAFRRNFRMRSPDKVFEDVKKIREQSGVKQFLFWDSLAPPKTLWNLAKQIKETGLDVTWFAETKFEKPYLKQEVFNILSDGGCRFLQFGFESADAGVLEKIDKGNDLATVEKIIEKMAPTKVKCGVSWFVGFPGETIEQADKTFDYVVDHRDKIQLQAYVGTFLLGRDTLVYDHPERYGIKVLRSPTGEIDYVHADGTPHPDFKMMDRHLEVRTDVHIVTYSAQLFYSARNPEGFWDIVGLGRFGPFARQVPDLERTRVTRGQRVALRRFAFDWIDPKAPLVRRPSTVALVPRAGFNVPLTEIGERLFELADGGLTCGDLAARVGKPFEELRDLFVFLIDEGVLSVPWSEMPAPVPTLGELVAT